MTAKVEYEECRVSVENSTVRWVIPTKLPTENEEVPQDPLKRKIVRIDRKSTRLNSSHRL